MGGGLKIAIFDEAGREKEVLKMVKKNWWRHLLMVPYSQPQKSFHALPMLHQQPAHPFNPKKLFIESCKRRKFIYQ